MCDNYNWFFGINKCIDFPLSDGFSYKKNYKHGYATTKFATCS